MLLFAYKRFEGRVPEPGDPSRSPAKGLDDEDRALLAKVEAGFETVGALPQERPASFGRLLRFPQDRPGRGQRLHVHCASFGSLRTGSACLDRKAPWFQIKEDRQAAATSVYVILRVIDNLKTLISPVLPHSAQKIHEYLGYDGQLFGTLSVVTYEAETRSHEALTYDHTGAVGKWAPSELPVGQVLREPAPLFKKLDESVVEEEYARLEG
jgi:methionyl-tRNA synthetase